MNLLLHALCNTALQQVQCDKYLWHNKLSEPAPAAAPRRHLAAWCLDTLYHIQRAVHSQDGVASGAEIRHKWRLSIRYVHLLAHINVIVGWRGLEIPTIKDLHSNCEIIEASFIWNAIDRSAVWCGVDNRKYSDQCWAKPRYICKKLSPVAAFPAQSSSDCRLQKISYWKIL